MAWAGAIPELAQSACGCWVIVGQAARFAEADTRKGLALLALAAQASHGHGFPILLSPSGGKLDVAALPTPLKGAEVVSSGLGVKAVAKANAPRKAENGEYRLNVHPLPGLGLWLELGPGADPWSGAMAGPPPKLERDEKGFTVTIPRPSQGARTGGDSEQGAKESSTQ